VELVQTLVLFASTILWFLIAAKTHGRQIRLEREYRGIDRVDFRRETENHPWLEALWQKDRQGYWPIAGIGVVVIAIALFLSEWIERWAIIPFSVLAAMGIAFLVQGARSHHRLAADLRSGVTESFGPNPRHANDDWKRGARRGTLRWFFATHASMALSIVALVLAGMT
jgi:hypothetical protein